MEKYNLIEKEKLKGKWIQREINFLSLALMTASVTTLPFPQSCLPLVPLLCCTLPLKNKVHQHYSINHLLNQQDDILEMEEFYKNYLKELSNLFQEKGYSSSFEVSQLFEILLYQGFFSKDLSFQVQDISIQHEIPRLYGERVMSGTASCRHIATLFDDFAELFPFQAEYLSTYFCYPYEKEPLKKHAVNLIEVDGKKMVKDFTNQIDYLFVEESVLEPVQEGKKLVLSEEQRESTQKMLLLKPLQEEEYQEIQKKTPPLFDFASLSFFYQEKQEQLKRIAEVEESYSVPEIKQQKVLQKNMKKERVKENVCR